MIRLRLHGTNSILLDTDFNKAIRSIETARKANKFIEVQTPNGLIAFNPDKVIYVLEDEAPKPQPEEVITVHKRWWQ